MFFSQGPCRFAGPYIHNTVYYFDDTRLFPRRPFSFSFSFPFLFSFLPGYIPNNLKLSCMRLIIFTYYLPLSSIFSPCHLISSSSPFSLVLSILFRFGCLILLGFTVDTVDSVIHSFFLFYPLTFPPLPFLKRRDWGRAVIRLKALQFPTPSVQFNLNAHPVKRCVIVSHPIDFEKAAREGGKNK